MQKTTARMITPDIMKILACIFVVVIHHKDLRWAGFKREYLLVHLALLGICAIFGVIRFLKERKKGSSFKLSFSKGTVPILIFASFWLFKKFPVTVFILLSSYFMGKSFSKSGASVAKWYKADNLVTRILRFYIPFVPIFFLCLTYKIFVLKYEYSFWEVVARFVLGGFKPGSYYIPILAQLALIFPVVYILVAKFREKTVVVFVFVTFLYDYLSTKLGMNDIVYKFTVFRFVAHIALGSYASITNFKISKWLGLIMFVLGFGYAYLCVYTKLWVPTIFFQWQETSFVTACYMYPVLCFVMNRYTTSCYGKTKRDAYIKHFAASTYHIFLVQLMFYTTFGFALNDYIGNYYINMAINLTATIIPGMIYAYYAIPFENKLIAKLKEKL